MAMDAQQRENFKIYLGALKGMPRFSNGPNETWRDFEKAWMVWYQNSEIGNLVGIPKQKMALLCAMRDRAMRAVDQHGSETASFAAAPNLQAYMKLIRECFNPPSESQTARTDFERRKQLRQEPAVVYLAEKKALYYHAFPEAAARSYEYFKAEVLKGIYANYVKQKIIEQDPASEAALETCVANAVGKGRALYFSNCGKIADLDGLASTTRIRAAYVDGSPADVEVMDFEESRRVGDNGKCHTCNKPGHFARDCPRKGSSGSGQVRKPNPDRDMICNNCKKKGHRKANCWQLHPELKKGRKNGSQQRGGPRGGPKSHPRNRRVGDGQDEVEWEDTEEHGDFTELDDDEGAQRLHEEERPVRRPKKKMVFFSDWAEDYEFPEQDLTPFRAQAVPQRRGRGNRLH